MSLGLAASLDAFVHRARSKIASLLTDQVRLGLRSGFAVAL